MKWSKDIYAAFHTHTEDDKGTWFYGTVGSKMPKFASEPFLVDLYFGKQMEYHPVGRFALIKGSNQIITDLRLAGIGPLPHDWFTVTKTPSEFISDFLRSSEYRMMLDFVVA